MSVRAWLIGLLISCGSQAQDLASVKLDLGLPALPKLADAKPLDCRVDFTNGTSLGAILAGLTAETLTLEHPGMDGRITFPRGEIDLLSLTPPLPPKPVWTRGDGDETAPKACIKFLNGDWLRADLLFIREGKIELRLAGGQRLLLDMANVEWVYLSAVPAPEILTAPTTPREWDGAGWVMEDGKMTCKEMASLNKTFASVPEKLELRFSMVPSEAQRNFMFNLNFNGVGDTPINAWSQIRFNEAQLYMNLANEGKSENSSKELPTKVLRKGEDGNMHYRVFYDRTGAGTVSVYLNDRLVATKEGLRMPLATCQATFTMQPMRWAAGGQWSVFGVGLEAWDGVLPEKQAEVKKGAQLLVRTNSADTMEGELVDLKGAVIRFKTEQGVQSVDRGEVKLLRLHARQQPVPAPAGTVAVKLTSGGHIMATRCEILDDNVTLQTSNLPEITLPKTALQSTTFRALPEKLPDVPNVDQLIFRNGDCLLGKMQSITTNDSSLQWQYSSVGAGAQVNVASRYIASVRRGSAEAASEPASEGNVGIRLRSGDWMAGTLQRLADSKIDFLGPLGKTLSLPTTEVQTLFFNKPGQTSIWEGADQPETWWKATTPPTNSISFSGRNRGTPVASNRLSVCSDGCFLLSGNKESASSRIGRKFEQMPDRIELNFTARSRGQAPNLTMQLFYEEGGTAGLQAQVWSAGLYLYDLTPRRGARRMGLAPQQVSFDTEKIKISAERHRFRILADRVAHRMLVYVDDVLVLNYSSRNREEDAAWANAIMLSTDGGAETMISDLWLGPWNGVMPGVDVQEAGKERVLLVNGDELVSDVLHDDGKSLGVRFEGGELVLPHHRLLLVDFIPDQAAAANADQAAQQEWLMPLEGKKSVKVRLKQGGSITLHNVRSEGGQLQGEVHRLGPMQIPLDACRELVWGRLEFLDGSAEKRKAAREAKKR